jgi:F0F1-type ATP synthase alpha subunit
MYRHFDMQHKDLLERIPQAEGLTDELKEALNKALDAFKEQFQATHVAVGG